MNNDDDTHNIVHEGGIDSVVDEDKGDGGGDGNVERGVEHGGIAWDLNTTEDDESEGIVTDVDNDGGGNGDRCGMSAHVEDGGNGDDAGGGRDAGERSVREACMRDLNTTDDEQDESRDEDKRSVEGVEGGEMNAGEGGPRRSSRTQVRNTAAANRPRRGALRDAGRKKARVSIVSTAAATRVRREVGRGKRVVHVKEMHDGARWDVREVMNVDDGTVTREVWYKEHDEEWCHRYTVCSSPIMKDMFGDNKVAHDEMLGVIAARTYRSGEIITVYTGEDIGAADGRLDAYKGYNTIAALDKGGTGNRGRHVLAILMRVNDTARHMWRRLIDGYSGFTCAQHINAAYNAPKGWHNKARLCAGGTLKVMEGCVIREGEEILYAYGKDYWDRWGDNDDLKQSQVRQPAAAQQGEGGTREQEQDHGDQDGGESGDEDEHREQGRGGPSSSGGGVSSGERVVQRGDGLRVEVANERRRGKQRVQTVVAPAPKSKLLGRSKMPKGSKSVQWTAVAREAYIQQQRFERGEGGGVT